MLKKLRRNIAIAGVSNVEVIGGNAEDIPLPEASVDVVTSNGVLNLVPHKRKAFAEIHRVLKPGGLFQIADIVVSRPVGEKSRANPKLWAECVVGALVEEDYVEQLRAAGFVDVEVLVGLDYFSRSPSADTKRIATSLGAHSVEIAMRKAGQFIRSDERHRTASLAPSE
jgi:ubiquinone/menaquinone biosynthesis C-methylase UbiE